MRTSTLYSFARNWKSSEMLRVFGFERWRLVGLSLRMALAAVSLLLFVQLPRISALEPILRSKACGFDHIAYSSFSGHESFYLNGTLVDRDSFCTVLKRHYTNRCILDVYSGSDYCRLRLPLAGIPSKGGRKLLGRKILRESHRSGLDRQHLSMSINVGMAVPAVLVCCGLLCPCIWRKKKASAHVVLAKDPSSSRLDSTSSFEMNSACEKVQASPLRVPPSPSKFSMSPKPADSVHLTLSQIARATHNFSSSMRLGEGGFGTVYKARLENGQMVAIKRAKKDQFENLQTEFISEVELLSKIDHQNLVKLLGYVDKGDERLIITEYVPNGTLREHLDGHHGKILDFNQRLGISIDVAHGLTYLHLYAEKQIIHRDVKSSNILLTQSMRAKVADFGFARLGPMDSDRTHISTKVKGTVGYLDPEYMKTYQLTTKSDVYSFGMLLLELLTGRRPVELKRPDEERVTLRWVFKKYSEGTVVELVDPLMKEAVDAEILARMFYLAIECAAPIRSDRPDMKSVGEQLWAIRADYIRTARRG